MTLVSTEIRNTIIKDIIALDKTEVQIKDALGRILAENIVANSTQPAANLSAMDGYAVRADEIKIGEAMPIIGASMAGHPPNKALEVGSVMSIATGAIMPDGADAILLIEEADTKDEIIIPKATVTINRWIRKKGQDFKTGDELIKKGTIINSRVAGLLAALNLENINVVKKPRVGILCSGDEIQKLGTQLKEGQIINSNGISLRMLISIFGGDAVVLPICKDVRTDVLKIINDLPDLELLVVTGGASLGQRDIMVSTLVSEGMELCFHGASLKPGKPLYYGKLNKTRVFGLPGNPVSVYISSLLFIYPMICKWLGLGLPNYEPQLLKLADNLPKNGSREAYLRSKEKSGLLYPSKNQDSGVLLPLSQSDGLIISKINSPAMQAGDIVPYLPFSQLLKDY